MTTQTKVIIQARARKNAERVVGQPSWVFLSSTNAGAFKDNMDAIDTKDFNRANTGKRPPNSFRILLGVWTVVADEDMNLVALRRPGTVKGAGRKLHDKDRFS